MTSYEQVKSFVHEKEKVLFMGWQCPSRVKAAWATADLKSLVSQLYVTHNIIIIAIDNAPEFHAEAPQATTSEELAQGPYVAARAEFEPAILRSKGNDFTNVPPRPTTWWF